jgi:hypothetical protein
MSIIDEFPKCFHRFTHSNNNYAIQKCDYLIAIPYGKKYYAWFTYVDRKNVCVFIELNNAKQPLNATIMSVSFDISLSLGTVLYGTMCTTNCVFYIEELHWYKGENVQFKPNNYKLQFIIKMFKQELKQELLEKNGVIISSPFMMNMGTELESYIHNIKYSIYSIESRFYHNNRRTTMHWKNHSKHSEFTVIASVICDVYNLYTTDQAGELIFYDVALIPNYNTSILMNKLFRKIRENDNIDIIQESDSEDEFENDNKNILHDVKIKMDCVFNNKFKKWVPLTPIIS